LSVYTFWTGKIGCDALLRLVNDSFDFSAGNIIKELKLKDISYLRLAEYGHFGKDIFPWEHVDGRAEELEKAAAEASA
jgi:S-adenosylmethionine synthetase